MIRDSLLEWKKATEQLIDLLNTKCEKVREDVIQQINDLLNQREEVKLLMEAPFSENEKGLGQELLQLEKVLSMKLMDYQKSIGKELEVHQKKKVSIHAYLNPYNQVNRDGTFYDKKK